VAFDGFAVKVSRRSDVAPFFAMEIFKIATEREATGARVFHMEAGEPGSGAPQRVIERAAQVLAEGTIGYTESHGVMPLRKRIAAYYQDAYGVALPVERIFVTIGVSGGLLLAFLAAFDHGDRVALANPSYPAYRNTLSALGLQPVTLATGPETRFQPTVAMLENLDEPVQGLIVASPSNPTGTMLSSSELEAIAAYCERQGIRVISDEIYHGITYADPAATIATFSKSAIVANGFSKYFAMTGWRLGWMVFPEDLLRPVELLAQNLFVSPPALSQQAAIAAFDCREELDANVARYARNRAIVQKALPAAGFGDLAPCDGAFYAYADVSRLTNDSEAFCRQMLAECGVAATPGIDFDTERGRRFVRFSFAGDTAEISGACEAMKDWLRTPGAVTD
jgi:aspartate/methionine/tyrosine aminotransferase